ncbi:hypothetical protein GCM10027514_21980 [Azotobacter armeniacus]
MFSPARAGREKENSNRQPRVRLRQVMKSLRLESERAVARPAKCAGRHIMNKRRRPYKAFAAFPYPEAGKPLRTAVCRSALGERGEGTLGGVEGDR